MSNTTSRPRGLAQRALALFMALVLATTLTPSFALADEANATANSAVEQNAAVDAANESNTAAKSDSASKADATASADKKAEASDSSADAATKAPNNSNASNTVDSSASKSADQAASTPAATNSNEPAGQAGEAKVETVSATLKISIKGTPYVVCTIPVKKSETVEDLLGLAKGQGYIDAYKLHSPWGPQKYAKSITINGQEYVQPDNAEVYWESSINVNGKAGEELGVQYDIINEDGYSYELNLTSWDPNAKPDDSSYSYLDKNVKHPDTTSGNDSTSFVKNNGNTSTATNAPTSSSNASLKWSVGKYASCNRSNILSIGSSLYIATSKLGASWADPADPAILHKLDANGNEISSLKLFSAIDSTCRMVYTDGVIVIPLSNGRLQGVSASEMKTLWISKATAPGDMSMSTVTASSGMVFTGTTSDWSASSGTFFGINAITGECVWANRDNEAGYYWAGACKIGNVLVYGDSAGWLKAVEAATGKTVSRIKLSEAAIQSTVISNNAETKAYVMTTDGVLHEVEVGFDGSLFERKAAELSLHGGGTSTPTLFEGNIYVGGGTWNTKGTFNVIDAETMQVKSTIELPFYVQSAPLVAKSADGKTYAYFTCNGAETNADGECTSGGGAWVYCLETNTVAKLFDATGEMAQYCNKSIVMGADGTLYWTNDSGTLFALANAASSSDNNKNDEKPQSANDKKSDDGSDSPKKSGSTSGSSAAAQSPISTAEATESDEADGDASNEDEDFGVEPISTSSARNASSNETGNEGQIPWLPIAGIAVGCAGLIGVAAYLFRRRSL